MRTRPDHVSLRTTSMLRAMLVDTARELDTTQTKVLESGILLARKHFQQHGELYGEKSENENVL